MGTTISAWSAVSPLGIGRECFAAGLGNGGSATTLDRERWPTPMDTACLVPGFSVTELLGKRGTRTMDRATGLALVGLAELLNEAREGARVLGEHVGIVLGTSTGSAHSMMAFTRDSLTQKRPYLVNPAEFPNTVMNCAAGQCAIWHGLRGPNATIAGGRVTGLLALNYAIGLQRSGHATTVLCGAVEEFSVARAWLEHHVRGDSRPAPPLGEGCALLLLEPDAASGREPNGGTGTANGGAPPLAEVLALEFGLAPSAGAAADALAACLARALDRGGASAQDVTLVAPSLGTGTPIEAELRAVRRILGDDDREVASTLDALGDTQAASATFQIAACLTAGGSNRTALVTAIDRDGLVGCALLRVVGRDTNREALR
jgi:3-oxoacyl-[acyl-carrier-protein] synthase II